MAELGPVGTVVAVTLRNVFHALMSGTRTADEPIGDAVAGALEDAGMGEVSPEIVETALTHYADTAPLAEADLLAPLVTAVSHVPFDPDIDDLPSSDAPGDENALDVEFDDPVEDANTDSDAWDHDVDPMESLDNAEDDTPDQVDDAEPNVGQGVGAESALASNLSAAPVGDFGAGSEDRIEPADVSNEIGVDLGTEVDTDTDFMGLDDSMVALDEFDGFRETSDDVASHESQITDADAVDDALEDDFDELPVWDE
jgi:hypothetical protein